MITQTNRDRYREITGRAYKLIKQYAVMLVVVYISFTIVTNLLGINQRGAAFVISLGFFVIIVTLLLYAIHMIKSSANLLSNNRHDKS